MNNQDFKLRQNKILNFANELENESEAFAMLISKGMGKPIRESRGEVLNSISMCRSFASFIDDHQAQTAIAVGKNNVEIERIPLGNVIGIMPFNYPLWQVIRFAIPAYLAGNHVTIRPDPCFFDALPLLRDCFQKTDLSGAFTCIEDEPNQLKNDILMQKYDGLAFTGSVETGRKVAALCGEALIPYTLELGGSDAYIVCEDIDIDRNAKTIVRKRMENAGQSCISSKRILVHESILDKWVEATKGYLTQYIPADPTDDKTYLGPLVHENATRKLKDQVERGLKEGAELLYGSVDAIEGRNFPPMMLKVKGDCPTLRQEELFGPVITVIPFSKDGEAIAIANETDFGLGGAVFTNDLKRADNIADAMNTGMVAINQALYSHPEVPFGGIKNSGVSFECGREAINLFTHPKAIWKRT